MLNEVIFSGFLLLDYNGKIWHWWPLFAIQKAGWDAKRVAAGRVRQVAAIRKVYNTYFLCGGILVAAIGRWPVFAGGR